jgi:predicted AAA+ superfamily ATPase
MTGNGFRMSYSDCLKTLLHRIEEPAPGRIQLLSGPRQVGKTTLLIELAERLGKRAIYTAVDTPEALIPGFWEQLWARVEETASRQGGAVALLDEVHLLPDWPGRLKSTWDRFRREKTPVHILATGSSSLRIASGSRESLAGRFERITLTHWSAASLSKVFGIDSSAAADIVIHMGSYPGAFDLRSDLPRWSAYIRDAIIEPAIGRDVLALTSIRKPALLRQVFGIAASSPAQIVSLQKIQGSILDRGALETIAHYLSLLEEAYLAVALPKYSSKAHRRRSAPPKLIILNNAILAAMDPRGAPKLMLDPARFGAWIENACLAHAWNAGQRVSYWREEPLEVDAVIEGSWGSWAIEVKTGNFRASDVRGLLEFARRHTAFRPLMICDEGASAAARRTGVEAITYHKFLLDGPPR